MILNGSKDEQVTDVFGREIKIGDILMYPATKRNKMKVAIVGHIGVRNYWYSNTPATKILRVIFPYETTVSKWCGAKRIDLGKVLTFTSTTIERIDRLTIVDPELLNKDDEMAKFILRLREAVLNS